MLNSRTVDDGAYLRPFKKLLVDVSTSMAGLDRGLALANELFNALESAGYRVVIAPQDGPTDGERIDEREDRSRPRQYNEVGRVWSPYRPTVVYVDEVAIGLAVIEMSGQVVLRYVNGKYIRDSDYVPPASSRYRQDHTWTTTRELPCGRFRIIAFSPYRSVSWITDWQETPQKSLTASLAAIVKAIQSAAIEMVAKLEEAERQEAVRRQEWEAAEDRRKRMEDQRRIGESVKESRDDLAQIISHWADVVAVEQFLSGVDLRIAALPEEEREPLLVRVALARDFLGSQDPLEFFKKWRTC